MQRLSDIRFLVVMGVLVVALLVQHCQPGTVSKRAEKDREETEEYADKEQLKVQEYADEEELVEHMYEYAMPEWRDLSGMSRDQQIEAVSDAAVDYLGKCRRGEVENIDAEKAQALNQQWQREEDEWNKQWFRDLFDKENQFQTIDDLRRKIEWLDSRIELIGREVGFVDEELIQTNERPEKMTENLNVQLANIPISIVAIGRCEARPDMGTEVIRTAITNRMIREAVQEVVGQRVKRYVDLTDDVIRMVISAESAGKGMVSDTYYTDSPKKKPGTMKSYYYQIHRIDVYPFALEPPRFHEYDEGAGVQNQEAIEDSVEVFFDLSEAGWNAGRDFFGADGIQFWDFQEEIAKRSNRRVNREIRMFKEEYEAQRKELEARKDELVRVDKAELLRERQTWLGRRNDVSYSMEAAGLDSSSLYERYVESRRAYKEAYETRISYVNRSEQRGTIPGAKTAEEHVRDMAYSTFRDLREGYSKVAVLVEVPEAEDPTILKIKSTEISYKPEIVGFRILYFAITEQEPGHAGYLLNIAYKLRWSPQELLSLEENLIYNEEDYKLEWRFTSPSPDESGFESPYSILMSEPSSNEQGWRLPTVEELIKLRRAIWDYEIDAGEGAIERKYQWPNRKESYTRYLAYDPKHPFRHKGVIAYQAVSFTSEEPQIIDIGDDVFSLRVREGEREE